MPTGPLHRFLTIPKRKSARISLVFLLFFCGAQPRVFAASRDLFLFPNEQAAVVDRQVLVIGQAEASSLTLKIGDRSYPLHTDEGIWQVTVDLSPGENQLSLEAASGKKLAESRLFLLSASEEPPPEEYHRYFLHSRGEIALHCTACHPGEENGKPNYRHLREKPGCVTTDCHPGLAIRQKFVHGPMTELTCSGCHNPHGTDNRNFVKLERQALCFSCHTNLAGNFDKPVKHFPVARGECLVCHEPHQSDLEFHLRQGSIKELCRGCHGDRVTNHKVMHEPVEAGDCSACHNPHVSENKALLVDKDNDMCLTCHEDRKEEFKRKFTHKPVAEDCTKCHDPHGSATVDHLRTRLDENGAYVEEAQPIKEACLICHRQLNPEIAEQIDHAKVGHKPVTLGRCLVCHTPHSSNYNKQLRATPAEICFACHREIGKHILGSKIQHGPVHKKDCGQCHQVHGSQLGNLLAARFDTRFSSDFDVEKYRLCFNCHNQRVYVDQDNVETDFRNGTVNLHYFHVNVKKSGCKTCHDIHASNQEKHVRTASLFRNKYKIKIEFQKTVSGGTCMVGCHPVRKYDREKPVKNAVKN